MRTAPLLAVVLLGFSGVSSVVAGPLLDPVPARTLTGSEAWPWERVDSFRDADPHFTQEPFAADDATFSASDRLAFGGDPTPHSGTFLLHRGRGWRQAIHPVPVLLCPGAIHSASVLLHDARGTGRRGIAPSLISRGYAVFAITYAYPSGDNIQQAEQIANAILLIRAITGAPRVDVVAVSKGGIPARLYTTRMPPSWRTPYRGDVRRLVLIGVPNGGLDGLFRHPSYALRIGHHLPWDWTLTPFGWRFTHRQSLYNAERSMGHLQLLHRWDHVHPVWTLEPDALTTYYGGWGSQSHSRGIDYAIDLGGRLIERLNSHGVDPRINVAVLAGSKGYTASGVSEYQGRGDAAVFTVSALHTEGIERAGARVFLKTTLDLNHGELLAGRTALAWLDFALSVR